MPKRTIYVRDDDSELWERAEALSEGNLSNLLSVALKDFVARKEANMQFEDHGAITKTVLFVWGSHSTDGRFASGTSFDSGEMGSVRAEDRVRALKLDPSIANVQLEERRVFEDGWITRAPLDEWIRDRQGWRRAAVPLNVLGRPYLVRDTENGNLIVRNVGSGPAINSIYLEWQNEACRMTDFFSCMAGESKPIEYSRAARMWPPASIFSDRLLNARGEAILCSSADGGIWRFLPLLPTRESGEATNDSSSAEWITWYTTNASYSLMDGMKYG